MKRQVLKWILPIDDQWHPLPGTLVAAAAGGPNESGVLVWTECHIRDDGKPVTEDQVQYRIFGTGHELPEGSWHLKTIQDKPFVWHVYFRLPKGSVDEAVATDVRIPVP